MSIASLRNLYSTWRAHPVTKGNIASAAARFLRWQLASRIHGGKLVVPFVGPTRLVARRGQTGVTGNFYLGLAEFPEMAFLLHYLRPDDLFIDVGANQGVYSILASGVIGARSIAFEPIPSTVVDLKEQLRLNDLINQVEVRTLALGAKQGSVRFFDTLDTVNRVVADGEAPNASCEVPQSTLDDELEGLEPTLIKMDVEGYEYSVLKGGPHVLTGSALKAIILEVHDGTSTYGVDLDELEGLLRDAAFAPYSYDAFNRTLTEVDFSKAHVHGLSDNVLMIRDVDAVRRRLSGAARFAVYDRAF